MRYSPSYTPFLKSEAVRRMCVTRTWTCIDVVEKLNVLKVVCRLCDIGEAEEIDLSLGDDVVFIG